MPTGARQVETEGNILVCDNWEWWRLGQTAVLVTNLRRSVAVSAPVRWECRSYTTKSQVLWKARYLTYAEFPNC